VETVAEADRLAGPVVGDRQRAEPRVAGVPGHDRPAARQPPAPGAPRGPGAPPAPRRAAASRPRTPRPAGRAGRRTRSGSARRPRSPPGMIPNGPGFSPRTSARSAGSPSGQLTGELHRRGPDLYLGLAEERVARGQRDRPRLARQRADPDRAQPAVLAEVERAVAQQFGRPGQGQRDLAAAVPALVAEGVGG